MDYSRSSLKEPNHYLLKLKYVSHDYYTVSFGLWWLEFMSSATPLYIGGNIHSNVSSVIALFLWYISTETLLHWFVDGNNKTLTRVSSLKDPSLFRLLFFSLYVLYRNILYLCLQILLLLSDWLIAFLWELSTFLSHAASDKLTDCRRMCRS